jgi:hypothetical protein
MDFRHPVFRDGATGAPAFERDAGAEHAGEPIRFARVLGKTNGSDSPRSFGWLPDERGRA